MEQEMTTPGRGSPESAAWLRGKLDEMGLGQSEWARFLKHYGDDRRFATSLRSIQRMATGEARVSGEMRAAIEYLLTIKGLHETLIADYERQLELMRSGKMKVYSNHVDITNESIARVQQQADELRHLAPLTIANLAREAA